MYLWFWRLKIFIFYINQIVSIRKIACGKAQGFSWFINMVSKTCAFVGIFHDSQNNIFPCFKMTTEQYFPCFSLGPTLPMYTIKSTFFWYTHKIFCLFWLLFEAANVNKNIFFLTYNTLIVIANVCSTYRSKFRFFCVCSGEPVKKNLIKNETLSNLSPQKRRSPINQQIF